MYVSVLEVGWGVDGAWMPLPTHPKRYCDPASLVCREWADETLPLNLNAGFWCLDSENRPASMITLRMISFLRDF